MQRFSSSKKILAKLTVNGLLNLKQSSLTNKKEAGKILICFCDERSL
jgi:hypothetical protein